MCFGIAATCLSSIAMSLGCAACSAVGGVVSKATRFSYALMLLFASFLAVAMLTDAVKSWILTTFQTAWSLPSVECDGLDCFSPQAIQQRVQNEAAKAANEQADAVLEQSLARLVGALAVDRVMLGVATFHALMALLLFGVKNSQDKRAGLQNGAWAAKLVLYFGLIGFMFALSSSWFDGVTQIFRVGAFLFVLVQLTMLVESSYTTYDWLLTQGGRQEAANDCPLWNWVILLVTLLYYGFVLYVFGATVAQSNRTDEGCSEGLVAVCVVFLLMLVTTGLSVSDFVRTAPNGSGSQNGVFQSGMVAAYASYQVLSALINHPEGRCHVFDTGGDGSTPVRLLGLLFVFLAVLWSAVRNGSHTSASHGSDNAALIGGGALEAPGGYDEQRQTAKDDEVEQVQYSYSQFHVEFCLAAMYIAMLLTRWGEVEGIDTSLNVRDSEMSVWVKIVSSWLCFGLYTLAMVLPPMCPDREFAQPSQASSYELGRVSTGAV